MAGVAPVCPLALLSPASSVIFSSCVSACTSSPARLSGVSAGLHHGLPEGSEHGPVAATAGCAASTIAARAPISPRPTLLLAILKEIPLVSTGARIAVAGEGCPDPRETNATSVRKAGDGVRARTPSPPRLRQ